MEDQPENRMRVLFVNQFGFPDIAPTGRVLHDLARCLAARGHDVTVLCSRRGYEGGLYAGRETIDGIRMRRIAGFGLSRKSLAADVFSHAGFFVAAAGHLLAARPRPDLIVSLTTPPYIGLVVRMAARLRGCRHAHWVMDVYPDVMEAHGMLRRGTVAHRMMGAWMRCAVRGSSLTVALGPDMAERLAPYAGKAAVEVVPLWPERSLCPWPDGEVNPLRVKRGWRADELVLLYSGNLGLGHRFHEFREAAVATRDEAGIRWAFAGGGRRRGELASLVASGRNAHVEVLPYVAAADLRAHLCSADVHLTSLDSAWSGCMVPSKIQGIFAVGRPVIYVGPADGTLGRWIREAGAGWVVRENDVAGLLAAVREARDPGERERRGRAARAYAEAHFDRAVNCARIAALLESAVQPRMRP